MIRTEDDIRAACETLEQDAPDVDEVLAAFAGRSPRRRRWHPSAHLAVAATIAVVAAIAVAAMAVAATRHSSRHSSPGTAAASTPPVTSPKAVTPATARLSAVDFTVASPSGYPVAEYAASALFQRASFSSADGGWATVTRYRAGGYDGATTGTPVRVNGHPGVIVADAHPTFVDYRATDPGVHQRAIVWQYAPGAWAMATGASGATSAAVDDQNLLLAQAIRPGRTEIRVPAKLGYLPAGLTGEGSTTSPRDVSGLVSQSGGFGLGDGTPAASPLTSAPWGSAMDLNVWAGQRDHPGSSLGCPVNARTFTIGADQGCYLADAGATSGLIIDRQGHTVRIRIDAGHYGKYSDAQLVRILAELTFAPNVNDPATWFRADSALP